MADQQPAEQGAQPGIQILTQYIKDLSFESPNAPESLISGWPTPETNVQVFLGRKEIKKDNYECVLHFRVEAKNKENDKVCFIVDLHYAAMVMLNNIPEEQHQPVLMVEVPKLLFPFARELVAKTTANGGYPPLYLAPISFEAIYMNEMKRVQDEQGKQAG